MRPELGLALLRPRRDPGHSLAEVVERIDELETGMPEQRRQAPALAGVVDRLERDVMTMVAARLGQEEAPVAERVVLHVGLMKSGTSFLQQALRHNRERLHEQGVLFPSPWKRQVQAVKDISARGLRDQPSLAEDGPWRSLVDDVRRWDGTAVLSMEFLGPRGLAKARQIVAACEPAEVEVVISVRDLARTIPAMWQESLQNRGTWTWEEYLAGVEGEDRTQPGPGRAFWTRQDAPGITEVWQEAAGRDRVTVLTVPPPGAPPGLLWERFASLLPVDGAGIDLDVRTNPSLGLASLLVLRELNQRLDADGRTLTGRQYERVVKQLLAKRGLAGTRGRPTARLRRRVGR